MQHYRLVLRMKMATGQAVARSGHLRRRRDPAKFAGMARALIDPENSFLRNAAGVVAAAILIPIAVVVKLISTPFERPAKRTAEEVAQYLRGFLNDSGDEWDWDDFTSVPLSDPNLESIRRRAASVELPVTEEGRRTLVALLGEAEAERNSAGLESALGDRAPL
jgi:hypothetical protein